MWAWPAAGRTSACGFAATELFTQPCVGRAFPWKPFQTETCPKPPGLERDQSGGFVKFCTDWAGFPEDRNRERRTLRNGWNPRLWAPLETVRSLTSRKQMNCFTIPETD